MREKVGLIDARDVLAVQVATRVLRMLRRRGKDEDEDVTAVEDDGSMLLPCMAASVQRIGVIGQDAGRTLRRPGVCVLEPDCAVFDSRACGEEGSQSCDLDIRGVPMWTECLELMEGEGSTPLVSQLAGEPLGFEAASTAAFDLGAECLASSRASSAARR